MKFEFYEQVLKNTHIKFHENPSSGSRVIPCGRTHGHGETDDDFHGFAKWPENVKQISV